MENEELYNEKTFLSVSSLGAIIGFFIPLIMWLLKKDDFSDYAKKFLTDVLNFELVIFIILFCLSAVPIPHRFINIAIFIFNMIIALRCFSAAREQREYKLPINIQLIK